MRIIARSHLTDHCPLPRIIARSIMRIIARSYHTDHCPLPRIIARSIMRIIARSHHTDHCPLPQIIARSIMRIIARVSPTVVHVPYIYSHPPRFIQWGSSRYVSRLGILPGLVVPHFYPTLHPTNGVPHVTFHGSSGSLPGLHVPHVQLTFHPIVFSRFMHSQDSHPIFTLLTRHPTFRCLPSHFHHSTFQVFIPSRLQALLAHVPVTTFNPQEEQRNTKHTT
jgi:hypothetical protein